MTSDEVVKAWDTANKKLSRDMRVLLDECRVSCERYLDNIYKEVLEEFVEAKNDK